MALIFLFVSDQTVKETQAMRTTTILSRIIADCKDYMHVTRWQRLVDLSSAALNGQALALTQLALGSGSIIRQRLVCCRISRHLSHPGSTLAHWGKPATHRRGLVKPVGRHEPALVACLGCRRGTRNDALRRSSPKTPSGRPCRTPALPGTSGLRAA